MYWREERVTFKCDIVACKSQTTYPVRFFRGDGDEHTDVHEHVPAGWIEVRVQDSATGVFMTLDDMPPVTERMIVCSYKCLEIAARNLNSEDRDQAQRARQAIATIDETQSCEGRGECDLSFCFYCGIKA